MRQHDIPVTSTKLDRLIEWAGWIFAALSWILVIRAYGKLPDVIATHFDLYGQPDDFGSKKILFLLPAIGTCLYAGIAFLSRKPRLFNYPGKIREEDATSTYKAAALALRLTNLAAITGICYLSYIITDTGPTGQNNPGLGFLILFEAALLAPTLWVLFRKRRK